MVTAVGVVSWAAVAYCLVRCWLVRPRGIWHVPVISTNPALITPVGRTWRRRAYLLLVPFLAFGFVCVLLSH